jgi:hypothetical protein
MDSGAQTFNSPQRPTGWFGLAIVAVLLAVTFYDGTSYAHLAFASGVLLFGAVIVTVYLRPALLLREEHLLVRNALSSVTIPWGAIESVRVRHVMEVDVGERVVRALAFGRTARQQRRHAVASAKPEDPVRDEVDLTAYVVDRVRTAAVEGRHGSDGAEVTSTWRWPEIAVLVGLAVLTVVLVVLA